jgi:hypothetical protein
MLLQKNLQPQITAALKGDSYGFSAEASVKFVDFHTHVGR